MKKLAVTLSLLAIAAGAYAQGSITVANTTTTLFRTNAVGAPAQGGTAGTALSATGPGYYYEVLTAPSTVTTVDASLQALVQAGTVWSDTGLHAQNTGIAGRMSSASTAVSSWGAGVAQSYIIVGWSGNLGTTWSAVAADLNGSTLNGGVWGGNLQTVAAALPGNAFVGATLVGWRQAGGVVGSSTIPTPVIFGTVDDAQGTTLKTSTDLFVVGVPEPTSFALIGLGSAALLIFRRRKV
jgi:hypothetical protein